MKLDWFEGTTMERSPEEVMSVLGGRWVETRPANGYERACTDGAVTLMWAPLHDARAAVSDNENMRQMGVHVTIPGSADPDSYYDRINELGLAPSRFDLAFDTDRFTVDYVWDAYQAGRIQCLARDENVHYIGKSRGRQTIYFKCARHQVCVYDKAAEQGLDGTWTRIEYRFKGVAAKQAWSDYGRIIKRCHKMMRIMKQKYSNMALGKLDNNFAAVVRRALKTSENHYRFQLPAICPNLALERSRRHLKRLLSWVKTHICTDPQMLAELVNTSVKPDLCARIIHDLKRTNSEATDWASSFARHMQGSGLATTLTS